MVGIPVKQLKDKDGNAIQGNSPDKVGYFGTTPQALTWGTDNNITEDGWAYINTTIGASIDVQLHINGVIAHLIGYDGNGVPTWTRFMMPVKKGDTVKATGGGASSEIYFYPNRTNLENGGGEFDTLNILLASDLQEAVI